MASSSCSSCSSSSSSSCSSCSSSSLTSSSTSCSTNSPNSSLSNDDDMIRLNVGGQVFVTTRTTLTADPDSMLARMFAAGAGPMPGHTEAATMAVFIDRTPRYFEPVLHWLRTGRVAIPAGTPVDGVRGEAEFFQVGGLIEQLQPQRVADLDRQQIAAALARGQLSTLEGLRLQRLDLSGLALQSISFAGAHVDQADLRRACLTRCSFVGASGSAVDFRHCRADRLNANGAALPAARFDHADLSGAILSNCKLDDSSCRGVKAASSLWQRAVLRNVDFTGADLSSAHMQDADLRGATLLDCKLDNVHLVNADLRGARIDWQRVASFSFGNNKITAAEYDAVPFPDKDKLQFLVVDMRLDDDPVAAAVRKLVADQPVVVYGQFNSFDAHSRECDHIVREAAAAAALPPHRITSVEVGGNQQLMNRLSCITGALTFPMVWINGTFIGGFATTKALHASGQLVQQIAAVSS